MFPVVRCSFSGIALDARYIVLIDIVPVDNKRYRYAYHRSSWLVAGKADPPSPARLYTHPDAPYTGDQLRKQVVTFEKVKLTNNEMDKSGHVSSQNVRKNEAAREIKKCNTLSNMNTNMNTQTQAGKRLWVVTQPIKVPFQERIYSSILLFFCSLT